VSSTSLRLGRAEIAAVTSEFRKTEQREHMEVATVLRVGHAARQREISLCFINA